MNNNINSPLQNYSLFLKGTSIILCPIFFLFGSGLAIGITLIFYLQDLIPNTLQNKLFFPQIIQFTSPPPPPPPPPHPTPITPPSLPQPQQENIIPLVLNNNETKILDLSGIRLKDFMETPKFSTPKHVMKDEDLIWRAMMVPSVSDLPFNRKPKIAFMFLARGSLPLAPLWERFFQGHEGLYSIYIHSQPSFNGSAPQEGPIFHDRRVASKKVEWGKFNMVEAERRLLANALLDISNERFVLLSESCIPLYDFTTIYDYIINSANTFMESYDLISPVGRGRYNKKMKPLVTLAQWRKGSQWFEVDREIAIDIISDQKYSNLFKRFCRPACYSDEHYLPTFVTMKYWWKNENRTLTWVDWAKGGPHPTKFIRPDVTEDLLYGMRNGTKCEYNGQPSNMCYLFARKFLPSTLDRLLRFAPKIMKFG